MMCPDCSGFFQEDNAHNTKIKILFRKELKAFTEFIKFIRSFFLEERDLRNPIQKSAVLDVCPY